MMIQHNLHNAQARESVEPSKIRRVPLSRVSNNTRQSRNVPATRKITRETAAPPSQAPPRLVRMEPFHFTPISLAEKGDVLEVAEYENEIYRTLRQREKRENHLSFHQTEITFHDRNLLIDSICRVHYKLCLTTNTFYRFLGILDRYFTVAQVPRQKLKVIAAACLFIASKIEDYQPAQSNDLITLLDHAFTQRELYSAEISVINAIRFETTFATPLFYLTHFMRINGQTKESLLLARYILEICQSNEKFYGMAPSKMASIAVMVTNILNGKSIHWPEQLAKFTQYTQEDLGPSANLVREMLVEQDRQETRFMRRKYGSELFLGVAHITNIPNPFF